jgi:hypothetical protein
VPDLHVQGGKRFVRERLYKIAGRAGAGERHGRRGRFER